MNPDFIFDLGKVLVDFDYSIAARKIAARSSNPPEDLHAFLGGSQSLIRYETGLLTREKFFKNVRATVGFQGDLEEFSDHFGGIFVEIPEMTALQAGLRRRGFQTYIFSNTNDLAIEHIQRNFPFFKNFDGYIFSHKVGAMKPEAKIYEAMETMSGKRGADLIYIDDRPENISTGAARGWRTILHRSPEKTQAALKNLGF